VSCQHESHECENLIEERTELHWSGPDKGASHRGTYAEEDRDNLPEGVKRVCGGENGVACGQLVTGMTGVIHRAPRIKTNLTWVITSETTWCFPMP